MFLKKVRDGCMNGFSLANWEADKMEALVRDTIREEQEKERQEAKEKFEKEREAALKQGIEQQKLETIKILLGRKMSYEDIADITGKSIEEIKEISKSIF